WGTDERFVFRDADKQIVSTRSGRTYKMGQRVHVLLDRIDREQRRLQFALIPEDKPASANAPRKQKAAKAGVTEHTSPNRSGKPRKAKAGKTKSKARAGKKKTRGKR